MRENKRILAAIEPTPIDRLREFLKAEGFVLSSSANTTGPFLAVYTGCCAGYYTHKDWK